MRDSFLLLVLALAGVVYGGVLINRGLGIMVASALLGAYALVREVRDRGDKP